MGCLLYFTFIGLYENENVHSELFRILQDFCFSLEEVYQFLNIVRRN